MMISITNLSAEKTLLATLLTGAPQLKVIVSWILNTQFTYTISASRIHPRNKEPTRLVRKRTKVNVNHDASRVPRIIADQEKLAARIAGYSDDTANAHLVRSERVLSPVEAFIRGEQDVIRRLLIVRHDQNRPRVAKLPKMSIFVYFFPRKASIPAEEGVRFPIRSQRFTDIADCHE